MQSPRIFAANHHGERVFKAQRRPTTMSIFRRIKPSNRGQHSLRIAIQRLLQNCRERRARVLHVGIDAACNQRLMADVTPREIKPRSTFKIRLGFNLLRQQFTKDDLLREVLRTDDRMVGPGRRTRASNMRASNANHASSHASIHAREP